MAHPELISIITPTYNSSRFILKTIQSVQSQTYPFWEMIIIDDGSIDGTPQILKEISANEPRIKLTMYRKNSGITFARNTAIGMSRGRYLTFLDHDDLWSPRKLEEQIFFMRENNFHFTYTAYQRITESEKYITQVKAPSVITYKQFLKNTIIGFLTVMIDRDAFPVIQFEDEISSDLILWISLLKEEDGHGIQNDLAQYRIVSGSVSSNKVETAKAFWKILRRHENLSLPYSAYCFAHWAFNAAVKRLPRPPGR